MDIQDLESAESCFEKASILAPSNGRILEAYGSLLAEVGKGNKAQEVLMRAVEVSPDKGFEKYMYLGQIMEGEMGALHIRKGIQIIKDELSKAQHTEKISILKSAYCSALCALAEQLMLIGMEKLENADQQMEAQMLQECESLLREAKNTDVESPEPGQALASLRYEQGLADEALGLLRESMQLWFKVGPGNVDEEEVGDGEGQMAEDEKEDKILPSYEFRFECAKLLLELDESTDYAIQILEGLLAEDDRVPHVWQLLAMSYYGGNMFEEADEVATQAIELLKQQGMPSDCDEIIGLEELQVAISEAGETK